MLRNVIPSLTGYRRRMRQRIPVDVVNLEMLLRYVPVHHRLLPEGPKALEQRRRLRRKERQAVGVVDVVVLEHRALPEAGLGGLGCESDGGDPQVVGECEAGAAVPIRQVHDGNIDIQLAQAGKTKLLWLYWDLGEFPFLIMD